MSMGRIHRGPSQRGRTLPALITEPNRLWTSSEALIYLCISVIGTRPEPAKPAGLTVLQGWPVRSAKKIIKPDFFPNRVRNWPEPAGLDWGLTKLNLKKKTRK